MNKQYAGLLAASVLLLTLILPLSGCWDNRELDSLFIVTGVALDKASDPGQMDIAVQIGKTNLNDSNSGKSNSEKDYSITLKTTAGTMMEGLVQFDRNSSRALLLQHNQVLLLGTDLAEQGVGDRIDLFMRDQEARMEVLVMVADGRGEEILSAKLGQEEISGMYLSRVMQDLYAVSPHYRTRMLDFLSRLRDETSSPVAPVVKLYEKDGRQQISIDGMAVLKNDRMVGHLNNDGVLGYLWAMGEVRGCAAIAQSDLGRVALHIANLDTKRDVFLCPDGGVRVVLSVDATLSIGELRGFSEMTPEDLIPYLIRLAQNKIRSRITDTFKTAQELNADIYRFGASVHRTYPKEWRDMKKHWDELFPEIELEVNVKVHLPSTGQILKSIEMEGSRP